MALARLAMLKSAPFTGITDTSRDGELRALLKAATKLIEQLVGRQLLRQAVVGEHWVGDGSKRWYPQRTPIISISSITYAVGGGGIGSGAYEMADPVYENGALLGYRYIRCLSGGDWQRNIEGDYGTGEYDGGWKSGTGYKLNYTAGYDDTGWLSGSSSVSAVFGVPYDLEYACCDIAHNMFMQGTHAAGGRRGITSIGRGGESFAIERFADIISPGVQQIIMGYRRAM